jgi:predicted molibdopterin-dependent oxidoreductase YjgC
MRIVQHPILDFKRGEKLTFFFNGKEIESFAGETVAAALHAAGIRELAKSVKLHRPRGLFCAIGHCSSCLMVVDGQPNIRVCVTKVRPGMKVETQKGKGDLV